MRYLISILLLAMLSGCDGLKNSPVSLQDTPLPGHWYGERQQQLNGVMAKDRLLLEVTATGYVSYYFLGCESGESGLVKEKRLSLHQMPVKRITTVKMVLQSYPLTPKFELSLGAWPDTNGGVWVVDQISLNPIDVAEKQAPEQSDPEQWRCEADSLQ